MIHCKKITFFGNNVPCMDFIEPLQNHCLFRQSSAKIVHILEITCKESIYIEYQSWGKKDMCVSLGCEISINTFISYEMVVYFGNGLKNAYFIRFSM